MAEYQIKWQKEDFSKLKKAVNDFNKKIRRLEKEEGLLYLPETIDYNSAVEEIKTRSEYSRKLKSLESFMKKGAEDLYITKGGEGLSKWEWQQLTNQKKIIKNRLNKKLEDIRKPNIMGRYNLMGNEDEKAMEDTLKSIEKLNTIKGASFTRLKERIEVLGVKDYDMKRGIIYRDNLLNELKELANNNPELKSLYDHFNNIKNPNEFYQEVKKSGAMQDFFKWYKNIRDYGDFKNYEEMVDYINKEIQEFDDFEDYVLRNNGGLNEKICR